MVKKRISFRRRRSFFKKRSVSNGLFSTRPSNMYLGKPVLKRFEANYAVYVLENVSITSPAYTFSSNGAAATILNYINTTVALTGTNEWSEIQGAYGLMNVYGVKIEFMSWLGNTTTSTAAGPFSYPPLYLDFAPRSQSTSVTPAIVATNDTALECIVSNTAKKSVSKFYRLPPYVNIGAGYPVGNMVWFHPDSWASAPANYPMSLYLGQANNSSNIGSGADYIYPVGSVRFVIYCRFAARQRVGG